jgi:hypothetical protein
LKQLGPSNFGLWLKLHIRGRVHCILPELTKVATLGCRQEGSCSRRRLPNPSRKVLGCSVQTHRIVSKLL